MVYADWAANLLSISYNGGVWVCVYSLPLGTHILSAALFINVPYCP